MIIIPDMQQNTTAKIIDSSHAGQLSLWKRLNKFMIDAPRLLMR